jgi:DNA-binding LacI/PurR family transcriptional regulator
LIEAAVLVPCVRGKGEEYLHDVKKKNIILFNRDLSDLSLDIVKSDQRNASRIAVEHCLKMGYRRIGIVIGPLENSLLNERYEGYIEAARYYGLRVSNDLLRCGAITPESGCAMTDELLSLPAPPQCILSMDNVLTLGVIRALKRRSLRVPEDMAFISMDDIANGELVEPRVTYVGQPIREIAEHIFDILTAKLDSVGNKRHDDRVSPRQVVSVPVELVIRDSCGFRGQKRDSERADDGVIEGRGVLS